MSQQWRGAPRPASGWQNYSYTLDRVSEREPLRTIAGPGCWCGLPYGHDWPGQADGAPHPRGEAEVSAMVSEFQQAKEQRRTERAGAEQVLKHGQMKKFKREVRDIILLLVNEHGVEYRLQKDGQHIFMYSGARGERPFKVAASRPVAAQMRFLVPWIREHFPHIDIETGKARADSDDVEKPFKCAQGCDSEFETVEEINEHYDIDHPPIAPEEDEMEVPKPTDLFPKKKEEDWDTEPNPPPLLKKPDAFVKSQQEAAERQAATDALEAEGWIRYVYPTAGPSQFFVVKDEVLRCTAEGCGYTKEGSFAGVHMHEAHHTGEAEEMQRKGIETRRARQERQDAMLAETLDVLLKPHGYVAVRKEDAGLIKDAARLKAENERLQQELDEIRTKFDLAREAFGL